MSKKKSGKKKKKEDDEKLQHNPKELLGCPDLSMLVYLEMGNVLINVEHRYCKMARKFCYTSVSTILIAINPYERLPIYGEDVINEFFEAAKRGRLPQDRPHPYGMFTSPRTMYQRLCISRSLFFSLKKSVIYVDSLPFLTSICTSE